MFFVVLRQGLLWHHLASHLLCSQAWRWTVDLPDYCTTFLAPEVLLMEHRASHTLGKHSAGGPHPTSFLNFLVKNNMEPRMQTCYNKVWFWLAQSVFSDSGQVAEPWFGQAVSLPPARASCGWVGPYLFREYALRLSMGGPPWSGLMFPFSHGPIEHSTQCLVQFHLSREFLLRRWLSNKTEFMRA